jgi:acetyl-CoA carboxylase carboxyl transferase subunit beta
MGSVAGEKISRALEHAADERLPAIVFCTSGGARMQEGIVSLMQMAKTSAAVARLDDAGGLFVTVFTDPLTAGVLASYASLGDIIIAEPGALVGFAGPRVVERSLKIKTEPTRSEFHYEHGMIDMIVPRRELRPTLSRLLGLLV